MERCSERQVTESELAHDVGHTGLNDLAKRIKDPHVTTLLRALDAGCYAGDAWEGAALASAIPQLPLGKERTDGRPPELAPLYR